MFSVSSKIAYFIFISGAFALLAFAALNYQALNDSEYLVLYLSLAFIFLFGVFVGRRMVWPLKKILHAANELADGNMHSRAYVKNNDELGQLAKALNRVAEKMEMSHYEKQKVAQSVALKVNSIVGPLHETILALEEKVKNRTADMHQAVELSEKLQINMVLKEAEFIDLKGELAKVMKRKSRKIINEEI